MDVYTKNNRREIFDHRDVSITSSNDNEIIFRIEDYYKGMKDNLCLEIKPVLEIILYEHDAEKICDEILSQLENLKNKDR